MEAQLCTGCLRFIAVVNDPAQQGWRGGIVLQQHLNSFTTQCLHLKGQEAEEGRREIEVRI